MRIITVPGVWSPKSDAWMLADVLTAQSNLPGGDVLDLGTGSGAIAVAAARAGARSVTAVDVSRRALLCAWANARLNGTRVEPRRGDLFAPVAGRSFDIVVSNPPYLPAPDRQEDGELPGRGAARAWEGGADGRQILDTICERVADHLRPGGTVLVMQSSVNGLDRTLDELRSAGLEADVAASRRGPLGPILASRADSLRERGLIGERDEEALYVVRGRRL